MHCEFQNYPIQGLRTAIFHSQTILFEFVQVYIGIGNFGTKHTKNIYRLRICQDGGFRYANGRRSRRDRKNGTYILKLDNKKEKSAHELFIDLPLNICVKRQRAKVTLTYRRAQLSIS